MDNQKRWLEELEEIVSRYEREVKDAGHAAEMVQSRLAGAERDLSVAKNFLEMERRKFASRSSLDGMLPKDACTLAVREMGRATIKEIIEWLEKRGFKLETEFPGRAVHAALLHASEVIKVAPATYEMKQGRLL